MKEKLLSLIVLFTVGEMTKAQELLPASQVLKVENKTMTVNKAPKKADDTAEPNFWVQAKAHYDEYGRFNASQLSDYSYKANVTFDGTDVTIDGIVNLDNYSVTSTTSIKGVYDADKKTITISTPSYSEGKPLDDYTQIATINYFGSEVRLMLFAGEFKYIPSNGQYGLETENKLVFDVSDDMTTLSPRTGYGAYGFNTWNSSPAGFLNFFKTASWMEIGDEARLIITPELMELKGQNITVGATISREFQLNNIGKSTTEYDCIVSGKDLKVYASDKISGMGTGNYRLEFTPTKAGEMEGYVEFTATNGSKARMTIKAEVAEAPDFSKIVKNGEVTFCMDEDDPFVLDEEITGFPVAVSTNDKTSNSTSTLHCIADVPAGKTGVLSWKGQSSSMQPNGAYIIVNDDYVFDNIYAHSGVLGVDDIANTVVLPEGDNLITFVNNIMMNWYEYGMCDEPFRTYIYDLDFQLFDTEKNAAMLKNNSVDMGRHFVDRYAITDTATIILLNLGSEPLKVTGFKADGAFSGVVDNMEAEYATELPVKLLFTADKAGEYEGNVVIETTAGEFTVNCKASAENIIYDYSPVVTEGEFSFNTSMLHPFNIDGHTATSSIAYAEDTYNEGVMTSWLEAQFIVPEGKIGTLSWDGNNSSADYFIYMENKQHNDGTIITIDGTIVQDYAGEMDASSTTFDEADLTFNPGLHKVHFLYRKIYPDPEGLDRFRLRDLTLKLTDVSGINSVSEGKTIVNKEIFSASGEKLNTLGNGVNIVRETYSDGTTATRKVIR